MAEEGVYELLIDENGHAKKGKKGGIKEVLIRLEQIEQKINEINKKIPEAQGI